MHVAHVGHVVDPLKLLGRHVLEAGEHRGHRVVHPHVDRSERLLHLWGGLLHRLVVGDIERDRQRDPTRILDVMRGAIQPALTACQQRHPIATRGELARHSPAHPGTGAGHHHHTFGNRLLHCFTTFRFLPVR